MRSGDARFRQSLSTISRLLLSKPKIIRAINFLSSCWLHLAVLTKQFRDDEIKFKKAKKVNTENESGKHAKMRYFAISRGISTKRWSLPLSLSFSRESRHRRVIRWHVK